MNFSLAVLGCGNFLCYFISVLVSAENMLILCGFALLYTLADSISGVLNYIFYIVVVL